jgi:hypothetical protein
MEASCGPGWGRTFQARRMTRIASIKLGSARESSNVGAGTGRRSLGESVLRENGVEAPSLVRNFGVRIEGCDLQCSQGL